MLGREYPAQNCSIARTLEIVGERWTLLILREAFVGTTRFDGFHEQLGIARNVLQSRLTLLVDEGLFDRRAYQDRPPRFEYLLTPAGEDLIGVMLALQQWGDRHRAPDGPPTLILHRGCGGTVTPVLACGDCGATALTRDDLEIRFGPGVLPEHGRPGELVGV
jgi:DNA-binding HxlR family transcriptional regulator